MLGPIAAHPQKRSLGFSAWGVQIGVSRFPRDSSDGIDPAPQRHPCRISVCNGVCTPNQVYRIYTPHDIIALAQTTGSDRRHGMQSETILIPSYSAGAYVVKGVDATTK